MPFGNVKLNDGHELPAIRFGTGTAFRDKDATDAVIQALETGFIHIDAAQLYNNEESVGVVIKKSGRSQSELRVTTKYCSGPVQESLRTSLTKLGLQYIDLYLLHHPTFIKNDDFEGYWRELEKIKEDGLATSIGVSNYNLEQLRKTVNIAKIKPAVNQISLHPYNYTENKALLEYAAENDIVIEAFNCLTPITKSPGGPVDEPIIAAAKRRGATPAQVIFAWIRAKGAVVVTTSSSKLRLQEYLAAADIAPLTEDEIAAIDAASAKGPMATL